MVDTRTFRRAKLATSVVDQDVSANIAVTIQCTTGLPVLTGEYINEIRGLNGTPRYVADTINTPTPALADVYKHLVDEDDLTRYTYIGEAISTISSDKAIFYHDSKYNDLIVLPDLGMFGHGADVLDAKLPNLLIEAKLITGLQPPRQLKGFHTTITDRDDEGLFTIAPIATMASTTVITAVTSGMGDSSVYNRMSREIGGKHYGIGEKLNLLQYVVFDTNVNLFGSDMSLSSTVLINVALGKYGLLAVPRKTITQIVIPLNF